MSRDVSVQYVGGPIDGRVMVVSAVGDPPQPPDQVEVVGPAPDLLKALRTGEGLDPQAPARGTVYYRYVRQPSPLDEGPLWLYVPAAEYADLPDPLDPMEYHRLADLPLSVEDLLRTPRHRPGP